MATVSESSPSENVQLSFLLGFTMPLTLADASSSSDELKSLSSRYKNQSRGSEVLGGALASVSSLSEVWEPAFLGPHS